MPRTQHKRDREGKRERENGYICRGRQVCSRPSDKHNEDVSLSPVLRLCFYWKWTEAPHGKSKLPKGRERSGRGGGWMRRESCYWDLKSGIEPKKQTEQIYKSLAKLKVTCHYSDIDMKGTELRAAAEREADRDSNNWKATQVGRSQSMMTAQTWACKWNWPQWELQQQQWQQARKLCSSVLES